MQSKNTQTQTHAHTYRIPIARARNARMRGCMYVHARRCNTRTNCVCSRMHPCTRSMCVRALALVALARTREPQMLCILHAHTDIRRERGGFPVVCVPDKHTDRPASTSNMYMTTIAQSPLEAPRHSVRFVQRDNRRTQRERRMQKVHRTCAGVCTRACWQCILTRPSRSWSQRRV